MRRSNRFVINIDQSRLSTLMMVVTLHVWRLVKSLGPIRYHEVVGLGWRMLMVIWYNFTAN